MYNNYFFRNSSNTNKHPFKLPTNFTAPTPNNSHLLECISNVLYDLKTENGTQKQTPKHNISPHGLKTIHELKYVDDIIISLADKGGAIVIWPTRLSD